MDRRIRVTAKRREPIDLEQLAQTLLAIVDDLDPERRAELAELGDPTEKSGGGEAPPTTTTESAA
jgi:hypothetical protein